MCLQTNLRDVPWLHDHPLGIEANPKKIQALLDLRELRNTRDVQKLIGQLAALHRFLSNHVEKALHFFKILHGVEKKDEFQWTEECQRAFKELRTFLGILPLLTRLVQGKGTAPLLGDIGRGI